MTVGTKRASIWRGIALGVAWTSAFLVLAIAVEQIGGVPNPAFRTFEWLARELPGAVITRGIDATVHVVRALGAGSTAAAAKRVEEGLAVVLALGAGAVLGAVVAALINRGWRALWLGAALGVACALVYLVVIARGSDLDVPMILATLAGFAAWGLAIAGTIDGTTRVDAAFAPERRRWLLVAGIGAATLAALALGIGRLIGGSGRRSAKGASAREQAARTSGAARSPSADALAARIAPVRGTRPELTANEDFYRVDINLTPPSIDPETWRLEIGGLVARPLVLTLDELRARPAISQIITLECISNPVGGDLISTSRWTGVRVADVLDEVGVKPAARALSFEAADGYYESASLDELRDPRSLLVYAMNGEPLPEAHGFPLRLYIPDRHGMKLPKWIRRIEAVAEPRAGYWVERGWSATAIPHTTSVIDAVHATGEGERRTMSIGGIAYAGARGIRSVEVQVDGGIWVPAQLRAPALSPLTWVQWRLDLPYRPGRHTFRVRAVDGTGAVQEATVRPPHPDGATGLYARRTAV
jgi:DMSO/TMAO reductase YedYZ molybdopterin-dependent catalytic subunit